MMVAALVPAEVSPAAPIDIDDIEWEVTPFASHTGKIYHGVTMINAPRTIRMPARRSWRFERLNDIIWYLDYLEYLFREK
jgi:hypothetical protein